MLPLLLLPAMLCDAELYRAQMSALADRAVPRIAVLEAPSLEQAAQSLLESAPPRFAVAGTSAGGNLALEVLAAAPERVAGLWLMGSSPGTHGDPDGARALNARVRAGEFDAVVDELAARAVHVTGPHGGEAAAVFRRMAHRMGAEACVRQNEALITRADRWHVLDTLRVPTLLLWGRHDQFSSVERAQAIASRVATADLVVLEDCGHLPTLEHPDACTAAARRWLSRCQAATVT